MEGCASVFCVVVPSARASRAAPGAGTGAPPEEGGPWSCPDTSDVPEHHVLPDGPGNSLYLPPLQDLYKRVLCLWSPSVGTDVLLFSWQRDQKVYPLMLDS